MVAYGSVCRGGGETAIRLIESLGMLRTVCHILGGLGQLLVVGRLSGGPQMLLVLLLLLRFLRYLILFEAQPFPQLIRGNIPLQG